MTNKEMLEKLVTDASNIEDYLVTSKKLGVTNPKETEKNYKPEIILPLSNEAFPDVTTLKLSDNALSQISAKMNINSTYLRRLHSGSVWEQSLFTRTLVDHLDYKNPTDNFLLRTNNGILKGFLSDRYERYDSNEVLIGFLTKMKEHQFNINKVYYDGITYFVEMTNKNIPIMINDQLHWITVQYRNSDFGASALDIRMMITKQVCSNGMVLNSIMRKVHKGKELQANKDFKLSNETFRLEAELKKSILNDVIPQIVSEQNIIRIRSMFEEVNQIDVPVKSVIQKLPSIGATKNDLERIENIILDAKEETGVVNCGPVLKVASAISWMANDYELEEAVSANKYKEMSGNLISKYVKN